MKKMLKKNTKKLESDIRELSNSLFSLARFLSSDANKVGEGDVRALFSVSTADHKLRLDASPSRAITN